MPTELRPDVMLRKDVVAAIAEGKFHVHAVATADEALELATGRIADVRDHDGHFPVGSVNAPVEARLLRFADDVRRFAAGTERSAAASRVRLVVDSWALAQFLPWLSGFRA